MSNASPGSDRIYKRLYAFARMVEDLLRSLFADAELDADYRTLEKLPAEYVGDAYHQRHGDTAWRLRTRGTDRGDGWLHVLVMLEFQSSADSAMALRVLEYTALLYGELLRNGRAAPGALPAVLPVVLYNGDSPWRPATEMRELIAAPLALAPYQPSQRHGCTPFLCNGFRGSRRGQRERGWSHRDSDIRLSFTRTQAKGIAMTERMLAREALERKEKWEFLRLEVGRLVEGSEELGALAAALVAGDGDFGAFERGGRGALLEGFAEGLSARLSALDAAREAPTCGECGSRMRRRGSRRLSPVSLFGRLELKRGYWTRGCSTGGTHPLDAALGVGGRAGVRLTPAAMRALARLGAEKSYAGAAELFGEVAGVAATAKRAERCARQVGREIAAAEIAAGEDAAEEPGEAAAEETMYWSPDGTGVPVRRGEAGAGRDGGEAKTREAKTMVFHTAEGRNAKTGLPRSDAGSARYSAAIDSAESKDTDSEPSAFARRTWLAASLFGFVLAKRKVVVADGAKWIWNVVAELFPGAVEIVDVWHARERLWEVARAVYGPGTDLCRRWAEQVCEALWEGRVDDVLAELRRHAPTHETAAKCVGHVEGNRHRMNYPRFRAMGLLVGSGMVESACGTLVGERLKCNGMHWSVPGANDIMALRCCIRNERYDDFWRCRNKQAA